MEEAFRMRPSTPRAIDHKSSDYSEIYDPTELLSSLTKLPESHFPSLRKLELKVDSDEISIHNFGSICPQLVELKLNGSSIDCLRSLGTNWSNLEVLWLVRTSLTEIDGISAFPKLKELYCAFNSISNLSALMFHDSIEVLDIEGNKLEDWNELEYLRDCPKLFSVTLEGNPITRTPEYRQRVFRLLTQISALDDTAKGGEVEAEMQEVNEEVEVIHNSVRESAMIRNKSEMSTRPSTARNIFKEETSHLTEEVFSGNPLKAMRFRRRKMFQGEEDIMNLIREFKFEGGSAKEAKTSVVSAVRNAPIKAKNLIIRSGRREEFYDTN